MKSFSKIFVALAAAGLAIATVFIGGCAKPEDDNNTPIYVNSLEECVDTKKQYVLPDGFIYEYKEQPVVLEYTTNQIPLSTNADGEIYNSVGFAQDVRINSEGDEVSIPGISATGFIPITAGDILYFANCKIFAGAGDEFAYNEIICFDSNKMRIGTLYIYNPPSLEVHNHTIDENNNLLMLNTKKFKAETAYIRISCNYIGTNSVISINEEIKETIVPETYQWVNTGVVFDPTAYEDFELNYKVPDYIKEEAKEVADKINSKKSADDLVLIMGADLHVNPTKSSKDAILHMGMGVDEVRKLISPKSIVLLGDYNYASEPLSAEQGEKDMKLAGLYLSKATKDTPAIWLNGNHDYYATSPSDIENRLPDEVVYELVGKNTTDLAVKDEENLARNYGYIDYEDEKIRLIYLNTTDINGIDYTSHFISQVQGQWFISTALDLSNKENEEDWGVVICSHIPFFSNDHLRAVLCNYKDKTQGSNFGISYDFSNVKADLLTTFHGHIHNFKVTGIRTPAGNTFKAICIPNAVPGRENPYTGILCQVDADGNPVSFPKTPGTAEETSFNAVVIDRQNKKVHAICYGAGYDREIDF